MPETRRRRRQPDRRRRALGLLASCRDGCTEALMAAHGFSVAPLVELVRTSNNKKSGHTYDIGRIRNSKPYCSNIALAVIERRYAR
jgi:hypothetical protein